MPHARVLDPVGWDEEVDDSPADDPWQALRQVAACEPEAAEDRLRAIRDTEPDSLDQLMIRVALARRAAGLPVFVPGAE